MIHGVELIVEDESTASAVYIRIPMLQQYHLAQKVH